MRDRKCSILGLGGSLGEICPRPPLTFPSIAFSELLLQDQCTIHILRVDTYYVRNPWTLGFDLTCLRSLDSERHSRKIPSTGQKKSCVLGDVVDVLAETSGNPRDAK